MTSCAAYRRYLASGNYRRLPCMAPWGREHYQNGRQLAAWMGLVPRQFSSGGKQRLLGITKRGDKYLRKLLVHGGSLNHDTRGAYTATVRSMAQ